MKAVVFDIGNVLVSWDPVAAFLPALGTAAAVDAFLARTGFATLNLRADAGARFADLACEIEDPQDRALFASYPEHFHLSIAETISGTWALARKLRDKGHALHAITNWSAETWPIGLATHPELATLLGEIVVSGREGMVKPAPEIFALLCARTALAPQDCLFIDDSATNVAGALRAGMAAEHFTTPAALEAGLIARGLL